MKPQVGAGGKHPNLINAPYLDQKSSIEWVSLKFKILRVSLCKIMTMSKIQYGAALRELV